MWSALVEFVVRELDLVEDFDFQLKFCKYFTLKSNSCRATAISLSAFNASAASL